LHSVQALKSSNIFFLSSKPWFVTCFYTNTLGAGKFPFKRPHEPLFYITSQQSIFHVTINFLKTFTSFTNTDKVMPLLLEEIRNMHFSLSATAYWHTFVRPLLPS